MNALAGHDAIPPAEATDAVLRLASIALRRFTRDPQTRATSSLNLLRYAIRLHALETSAGAAALAAGEAIGELAVEARRRGARA